MNACSLYSLEIEKNSYSAFLTNYFHFFRLSRYCLRLFEFYFTPSFDPYILIDTIYTKPYSHLFSLDWFSRIPTSSVHWKTLRETAVTPNPGYSINISPLKGTATDAIITESKSPSHFDHCTINLIGYQQDIVCAAEVVISNRVIRVESLHLNFVYIHTLPLKKSEYFLYLVLFS